MQHLACKNKQKGKLMSTYHTVKENNKIVTICKLGTTENMYYVRLEEAYIIRSFDINKKMKLLFMDLRLIWRFRWPDEDIFISYQNEESFKESYQRIVKAVEKREPRHLIFKINAELKSLETFSYAHENNCIDQSKLKLIGDRYCPSKGFRTIFSCLSCNELYAFSSKEIEEVIKPGILSLVDYSREFLEKVVEKIYPHNV